MRIVSAKRHHYVPRMLLRRFSPEPQAENPLLWRLDRDSGEPSKTSVNNEAVIGHYYRMEGPSKLPPGYVEHTLGLIETDAAEVIRKLIDRVPLDFGERLSMAMFLHVQRQRTPQGRQWSAYMYAKVAQVEMEAKLRDPGFVRSTWKELDPEMTDDDIDKWRLETLSDLQSGRLTVEGTQNHEVGGIFFVATDIAPIIAGEMTWLSLRAPRGSAFICSDHPVHIYSKEAPSVSGVGWLSPGAEATIAIDQNVCLMLRPGPPELHFRSVNEAMVQEVNLRAYASAQWAIYGASRRTLQELRTDTRRRPIRDRLAGFQPRPPNFVLFESVEGEDEIRSTTVYRPPALRPERRPKREN